MKRYNSYSAAMERLFGEKVYKLSLDGGMSCPNRDGRVGTRGCSFCAGGSGDFAAHGDILAQIEDAKARVAGKFHGRRYIAYFQSYTNTYAPLDYLRWLYDPVLARPDIAGLAIGTRPDCLPREVVEYLSSLNREKPVWVELGLQTIHEPTARAIRRGYPLPVFDDAVARLSAAGLRTVAHVILGLPGEDREMMLDTVRYVGACGAEGIKLQLLHVLKGTDMARDYMAGAFSVLTLEEYIQILEDSVRILPPHIVIHRLTGDGAKRRLIAPSWSGDKKRVLNAINAAFEADNIRQGEHV